MRPFGSDGRKTSVQPIALLLIAAALAACGGSAGQTASSADDEAIVLSDPSDGPRAVSEGTAGDVAGVKDPSAYLEVEDQTGDGTAVTMEAVVSDLPEVHVVIMSLSGEVLGSESRSPGVQPVVIQLSVPVGASQELVAQMLADDGDGLFDPVRDLPVLDQEGEVVEEDFFYRVQGGTGVDD